jgi:hypothetical protein
MQERDRKETIFKQKNGDKGKKYASKRKEKECGRKKGDKK